MFFFAPYSPCLHESFTFSSGRPVLLQADLESEVEPLGASVSKRSLTLAVRGAGLLAPDAAAEAAADSASWTAWSSLMAATLASISARFTAMTVALVAAASSSAVRSACCSSVISSATTASVSASASVTLVVASDAALASGAALASAKGSMDVTAVLIGSSSARRTSECRTLLSNTRPVSSLLGGLLLGGLLRRPSVCSRTMPSSATAIPNLVRQAARAFSAGAKLQSRDESP
ncbi:hypothetical protein T492DRAFT_141175, partial [Pavlovales sp. CCMP2436]